MTTRGQRSSHLHQKRALAHAGIATQQNRGSGDESTTKDSIEFLDRGGKARDIPDTDGVDRKRDRVFGSARSRLNRADRTRSGRPATGGRFIEGDEGVPGGTLGAPSGPLSLNRTAVITEKAGSCLCHGTKSTHSKTHSDTGGEKADDIEPSSGDDTQVNEGVASEMSRLRNQASA